MDMGQRGRMPADRLGLRSLGMTDGRRASGDRLEPASASIRQAQTQDAAPLARLMVDFGSEFGEAEPTLEIATERFAAVLGGDADVALLAEAGNPVGFAFLRIRPSVYSRANEAYLQELYVRPEARGNGLGEALLRAALDAARERGCDRIDLGTAVGDTRARGLYEKLGFTNYEADAGDGSSRMLFYEREL